MLGSCHFPISDFEIYILESRAKVDPRLKSTMSLTYKLQGRLNLCDLNYGESIIGLNLGDLIKEESTLDLKGI